MEDCAICLEQQAFGGFRLGCGHAFHASCILYIYQGAHPGALGQAVMTNLWWPWLPALDSEKGGCRPSTTGTVCACNCIWLSIALLYCSPSGSEQEQAQPRTPCPVTYPLLAGCR